MIYILTLLIAIWFLQELRNLRKIWIRMESHQRIEEKITALVTKKLLKKKRNSIFDYYGEFGSTNPEKVILLQAGVHGGLELFAIEVLLDKVARLDSALLEKQRIRVIVIPIVNQWGFDHAKRTNRHRVDLARNSGYVTTHLNKIPFVVGWSFYNIFMIIPVLLTGKTWYNKGFKLQQETETLMRIYRKNLRRYQENFFCFDFHTGNTSGESRLFFHELYRKPYAPSINTLWSTTSLHIEMIDYGTDGGFFEKVALDTDINFNAFTIEFAVIAEYTHKKYVMRYFFSTVFEPLKKEYEVLKQQADTQIDDIFASLT